MGNKRKQEYFRLYHSMKRIYHINVQKQERSLQQALKHQLLQFQNPQGRQNINKMDLNATFTSNEQITPAADLPITSGKAELYIQTDVPERVLHALKDRLVPDESELVQEASWIHAQLHEPRKCTPENIRKFIETFRTDHLDPPYTYTYKTELYDSEVLNKTTIWEILRLDRDWTDFYKRKNAVLARVKTAVKVLGGRFAYLEEHAMNANNLYEVEDVEKVIDFNEAVNMAKNISKENVSAPIAELNEKQQEIARWRALGLHELIERFSLSADKLNANYRSGNKENMPPEVLIRAYTLAKDYLASSRLTDEHLVLAEASKYLAAEIAATQPLLRKKLREHFLKKGEASTTPTPKGALELDVFHPSYRVKRISKRPLYTFLDDIWLDVLQKEHDGLIVSNICLNSDSFTEFTNWMENLVALNEYELSQLNEPQKDIVNEYNEILKTSLSIAIKDFLLPDIKRQIRNSLENIASQYVVRQAFQKFKTELMASPFYPPINPVLGKAVDSSTAVLSVVVDTSEDSRKKPVQIGLLDETGELCEEKVLLNLAFKNPETMSDYEKNMYQVDLEMIKGIIRKKRPKLLVIGTNCAEAGGLFKALSSEAFLNDCYGALEAKLIHVKLAIHPFPSSMEIPPPSNAPEALFNNVLRTAVSLGRYAQNPMAELLNIFEQARAVTGDKLDVIMSFHPMQALAEGKSVIRALKQAAVECVNEVGIDINSVTEHNHLKVQAKYLAGLGKVKAEYLLNEIKKTGELKKRIDLLDRRILKPLVYKNCAGFIKVIPNDSYEILDTTRIHPDSYFVVRKCAVEALTMSGQEVSPLQEDNKTIIESVKTGVGMVPPLEKYLATCVQNESSTLKGIFAAQLLQELKEPFKDPREGDAIVDEEQLSFALSGQSKHTLFEGKIVTANVIRAQGNGFLCRLESGIEAILDASDDADGLTESFKERDMITTRITKITAKEGKLEISLSAKSKDLKQHDKWVKLKPQDRTWFYIDPQDLEGPKIEPMSSVHSGPHSDRTEEPGQQKVGKYIPRSIKHARFRNVSLNKAIEYLSTRDIGEYLFRPSSNGPDHLTLTLKFYRDVYVHIDVREESKPPGAVIGEKLFINDDSFTTLDEIVKEYITPVMKRVKEVTTERKFVKNNSLEFLKEYLALEYDKNPNVITYCFGIVPDYPQYVVLLIHPRAGKTVIEYIKVKPQGFYFHDDYYNTMEDVVKYFKSNFASVEYQRFLRKRNRPPALQVQPCDKKHEEKIDNPVEPMQTTYLPETEYQRPLESIMTDNPAQQSVYIENAQFSVYGAPAVESKFGSTSRFGIAGKRPAAEDAWGTTEGDEDRGGFKEPFRPTRLDGRRGSGFGGGERRGRGRFNGDNYGERRSGRGRFGGDRGDRRGTRGFGSPRGRYDDSSWKIPSNNDWGTSEANSGPATNTQQDAWGNPSQEENKGDAWGSEPAKPQSPMSDDFRQFNTIEEPVKVPTSLQNPSDSWGDPPAGDTWGNDSSNRNSEPAGAWGTSESGGSRARGGPRGGRGGNRGGRGCFNCGEEGHLSRDCPKPSTRGSRGASRGGRACFNCGEEGHISKDCPKPSTRGNRGGGRGNCFNCGQPGHMSRECPERRGGDRSRGRGGERRGRFSGGRRGGSEGGGNAWGAVESTSWGSDGGGNAGWGDSADKNENAGGWGTTSKEKKVDEGAATGWGNATEEPKKSEWDAPVEETKKSEETKQEEGLRVNEASTISAPMDENKPPATENAEHSGWTQRFQRWITKLFILWFCTQIINTQAQITTVALYYLQENHGLINQHKLFSAIIISSK
eukprot:TRINITY_DN1607_c0_g1_i1.p1 TRINITY_DN1607_c0_g1~~TRINITY_DN1607_c0_g1_i1.p1  ORF type:complete len:1819 (-),score=141.65 TRINITY_DN1607_c0_g1_i1:4604-9991(-)